MKYPLLHLASKNLFLKVIFVKKQLSKGALELTIFGFDAKFRMSYQLLYTYLLIERCIDNMVLNRKYDCFVTPEWA